MRKLTKPTGAMSIRVAVLPNAVRSRTSSPGRAVAQVPQGERPQELPPQLLGETSKFDEHVGARLVQEHVEPHGCPVPTAARLGEPVVALQ